MAELKKERTKVGLLEADLKKAKRGSSATLKNAQLYLLKYNKLEESIPSIKEEVKLAKENDMREEVLL